MKAGSRTMTIYRFMLTVLRVANILDFKKC